MGENSPNLRKFAQYGQPVWQKLMDWEKFQKSVCLCYEQQR
jgi:hypothetical protein